MVTSLISELSAAHVGIFCFVDDSFVTYVVIVGDILQAARLCHNHVAFHNMSLEYFLPSLGFEVELISDWVIYAIEVVNSEEIYLMLSVCYWVATLRSDLHWYNYEAEIQLQL